MNSVEKFNRVMVLNCFIKHETLTVKSLMEEKILGVRSGEAHLNFLLDELTDAGLLQRLNGLVPVFYTITSKGIAEGMRLVKAGITR